MAGERILLIDDNAVTLKLTRALLELEKYEVATAPTAEEALRTIGAVRPQLVLTDVRLPGIDGLELTRRLRATAEWRTVPIIALTGLNAADDERLAFAAGCDAWLSKPIQSHVLRNVVRQHLDSKSLSAEPADVQDLIAALRVEFLNAGADRCRRLLAMLPVVAPQRSIAPLFDYHELGKALHDWAGGGGTFGLPRITDTARGAEALLKQPFEEIAIQLRAAMEDLLGQFTISPRDPNAAKAPLPFVQAPDTPESKPIILICDDDALVVAVIKSTLEASGMICRTASNGKLAFAMARNDRPDAMILDINMPALDGIQVLDELRRLESTRKLKVMLLTALSDTEDITRGVYHGADDYMSKPFDPAHLVERINALLAE